MKLYGQRIQVILKGLQGCEVYQGVDIMLANVWRVNFWLVLLDGIDSSVALSHPDTGEMACIGIDGTDLAMSKGCNWKWKVTVTILGLQDLYMWFTREGGSSFKFAADLPTRKPPCWEAVKVLALQAFPQIFLRISGSVVMKAWYFEAQDFHAGLFEMCNEGEGGHCKMLTCTLHTTLRVPELWHQEIFIYFLSGRPSSTDVPSSLQAQVQFLRSGNLQQLERQSIRFLSWYGVSDNYEQPAVKML